MSPRLPLEELGSTAQERRLLRRIGVVLVALMIGGGGGVAVYSWADTRFDNVEASTGLLERYVLEERAARCSLARNVFALCRTTGVICEPVSADCTVR